MQALHSIINYAKSEGMVGVIYPSDTLIKRFIV